MDYRNNIATPVSTNCAIPLEDGYVRLTFKDFLATPILHLSSGLDLETGDSPQSGATATDISGYTKWVSTTEPFMTIAWNWQLDFSRPQPALSRLEGAGSNIMLLDTHNNDLGYNTSLHALTSFIDTLPWQKKVLTAIGFIYS